MAGRRSRTGERESDVQTVYLTRRNLLTLLSKLDRAKAGEQTHKTIVKNDVRHKKYPCSDVIECIAVEDEDYYAERNPGFVHERDDGTLQIRIIRQ